MRVLVVTQIFPNAREPLSSPFNRQQFAALGRLCEVEVWATVPWFPGARLLGRGSAAARLDGLPAEDVIDGLRVRHLRTLHLPRLLPGLLGPLYAVSVGPALLRRRHAVDVVLGSWAYPDGFAAVLLGELLGLPAVVKLHGSDMNVVAELPGPRVALRWALPRARAVVAPSRALCDAARALGAVEGRIELVPNGIDPEIFRPRDRAAARAELGIAPAERILLYVGRLDERKGLFDLLAAFERLAPARPALALVLVGEGRARPALSARAAEAGLWDRVRLVGARPLAEVPLWMAAADLVTLPSHGEGLPNVLLEALACGRRVVATRVGGIPDVVDRPLFGELVPPRDPVALAAALERVLDAPGDPAAVAAAGARGGWAESAAGLHAVLLRAVGAERPAA